MRVFLVRHGQTAWNEAGIAQGHTDIPLDEQGLAQAEAVAAELGELRIMRVLTSDLQRAVQTASPLASALGKRVETTDLLRERCFGAWEGLPYGEITAQFQAAAAEVGSDVNLVRAPGGGESFADLWDRLDSIVAELWEARQNVAVITHGGTCAVLLARLLQGNLSTRQSFRLANGSITELSRQYDFFRITRYNETRHLDALADRTAPAEAASA
ncbi:MAG TPA: histidine phosphatase family protein [Fimbriimonadaceae bacterium]|nr:histidine phosphatase family protein [Fimbriimonadaceae bacterium]